MKLNSNIAFSQDGPEVGLIFDARNAQTHVVNGPGALLWKALANGADKNGLFEVLKSKFVGLPDDEKIERDVDAFLQELRDKNFLDEN